LLVRRELRIVPRLIFAFALIALMISAAYAPSVPPTLLWSDPTDVTDVALSANGQYVAAATVGEVRFYGRSSSTPIWTDSIQDALQGVAISADGNSVAASGVGGVYFWANARSLMGSTNPASWTSGLLGGPISQKCLDISGDGNYVLAGGTGPMVFYWAGAKTKSGIGIPTTWMESVGGQVEAVDISSDGNYVAVAYSSGVGNNRINSVAYWKGATTLTGVGQVYAWHSTEPTGTVDSVAVSDNGNYVAAASYNGAVLYWASAKTLSDNPLSTWSSAGNFFADLAISNDGNSVIAGALSPNMGVYFWSGAIGRTGGSQSPSWTYVTAGNVLRVVIDSAGDYMAAFNDIFVPPRVYFFNSAGSLKWTYDPDSTGSGLSISGDGGTLAVGTAPLSGTAYLFDTGFSTIIPPIPEYSLGLPILATFMVLAYAVIKRRTITQK
jgi:WD40 repeat protein